MRFSSEVNQPQRTNISISRTHSVLVWVAGVEVRNIAGAEAIVVQITRVIKAH